MLGVVKFHHSSKIYDFSFLKSEKPGDLVFVAPSPVLADTYRAKIQKYNPDANVSVVTISKFIGDMLKEFMDPDEVKDKKKGKTKLLMFLSTIWKIKFPGQSYELFTRAYNLLTDFRSISQSGVILESVLEEYDPVIRDSVLFFYSTMESMEIIDEHKAYYLLAEWVRGQETDETKNIIFYGFNFYSGSQIDLLKALSIRNDVYLPINGKVYDNAQPSDWIKWLESDEVLEIDKAATEKIDVEVYPFPKKHLSLYLNEYLKENKSCDVYIAERNSAVTHFSEIPLKQKGFKSNVDVYEDLINSLQLNFEEEYFTDSSSLVEVSELRAFLKRMFKEKFFLNKLDMNLQDFRLLKVLSLFEKYLQEWTELSEVNTSLSFFDQNIMFECVKLDAPRNSFIPIGLSENSVFDLSSIENYEEGRDVILTFKGEYSPLKSNLPGQTHKVEQMLTSIGPQRRSELEFNILREKIVEFLRHTNAKIFIETKLQDHDLSINGIFKEINAVKKEVKLPKSEIAQPYNALYVQDKEPFFDHISYSRLNTYFNCPKRYYLQYISKVFPDIILDSKVQLNDLGTLEHAIIEDYYKKYDRYSEENHLDFCKKFLAQYVKEKGKDLSSTEYKIILNELINYSRGGVIFVDQLIEKYPKLDYKIEKEIDSEQDGIKKTGSIDFFAHDKNINVLVDFKRGGGSIPSGAAMKRLEKFQVWFYKNFLIQEKLWSEGSPFIIGYLCLSNPEKSLLLTNDENLIDYFATSDFPLKLTVFDEQYTEAFEKYPDFEKELIKKVNDEKEFPIEPYDGNSCFYCHVANICPKQEVKHG